MEERKKYREETVRYIVVGILTTVLSISVFYLFDTIFQTYYLLANSISIIVSILFAFVGNKHIVFNKSKTNQSVIREFLLFVSLRLLSAGLDMIIILLLVGILSMNSTIAKLVTEFFIVISNYLFSKFIIFK